MLQSWWIFIVTSVSCHVSERSLSALFQKVLLIWLLMVCSALTVIAWLLDCKLSLFLSVSVSPLPSLLFSPLRKRSAYEFLLSIWFRVLRLWVWIVAPSYCCSTPNLCICRPSLWSPNTLLLPFVYCCPCSLSAAFHTCFPLFLCVVCDSSCTTDVLIRFSSFDRRICI